MTLIWILAGIVAALVVTGGVALGIAACMAEQPESESDRAIAARGIEDQSKGGGE